MYLSSSTVRDLIIKQLTCIELVHKKFENMYIYPNLIFFVWLFCSSCSLFFCSFVVFVVFKGISATSEDIPNKIEDLRSECSSDFGDKDSVTSPDMDEVTHGKKGK